MIGGQFPKLFARVTAIAVLAGTASACSIIPDWMGGDSSDQTAAQQMAAPAPVLVNDPVALRPLA